MLAGKWVSQADQSKQLRSALDELYMDDAQLAETLDRIFQPEPVQLVLFELEPVTGAATPAAFSSLPRSAP